MSFNSSFTTDQLAFIFMYMIKHSAQQEVAIKTGNGLQFLSRANPILKDHVKVNLTQGNMSGDLGITRYENSDDSLHNIKPRDVKVRTCMNYYLVKMYIKRKFQKRYLM